MNKNMVTQSWFVVTLIHADAVASFSSPRASFWNAYLGTAEQEHRNFYPAVAVLWSY
jgi:hypothetical protein